MKKKVHLPEVVTASRPGQPTKYKEEFADMLLGHMEAGYSLESFCAVADCCKDTIYEWLKVHDRFSDAYKKGKEKSLYFYEQIILKGIKGELPDLNTGLLCFFMKNRFGWSDKVENKNENSGQVQLIYELADDSSKD